MMPQPRKHGSHAERQAAYRCRCELARQQQLTAKGLPPTPALPTVPGRRRWHAALKQAVDLVEMVLQEREQYFDDRSETWQQGNQGDEFQEEIDATENARDVLADLLNR